MLAYMNSNTTLVIFAMVAMIGFATATVVIPYIHQVQAVGPGSGKACDNPGITKRSGSAPGNPNCVV